jgi:hypothetical protein
LSACDRFAQDKKAAGDHFSEACCQNATRISTVKTMQARTIVAEMQRLAA